MAKEDGWDSSWKSEKTGSMPSFADRFHEGQRSLMTGLKRADIEQRTRDLLDLIQSLQQRLIAQRPNSFTELHSLLNAQAETLQYQWSTLTIQTEAEAELQTCMHALQGLVTTVGEILLRLSKNSVPDQEPLTLAQIDDVLSFFVNLYQQSQMETSMNWFTGYATELKLGCALEMAEQTDIYDLTTAWNRIKSRQAAPEEERDFFDSLGDWRTDNQLQTLHFLQTLDDDDFLALRPIDLYLVQAALSLGETLMQTYLVQRFAQLPMAGLDVASREFNNRGGWRKARPGTQFFLYRDVLSYKDTKADSPDELLEWWLEVGFAEKGDYVHLIVSLAEFNHDFITPFWLRQVESFGEKSLFEDEELLEKCLGLIETVVQAEPEGFYFFFQRLLQKEAGRQDAGYFLRVEQIFLSLPGEKQQQFIEFLIRNATATRVSSLSKAIYALLGHLDSYSEKMDEFIVIYAAKEKIHYSDKKYGSLQTTSEQRRRSPIESMAWDVSASHRTIYYNVKGSKFNLLCGLNDSIEPNFFEIADYIMAEEDEEKALHLLQYFDSFIIGIKFSAEELEPLFRFIIKIQEEHPNEEVRKQAYSLLEAKMVNISLDAKYKSLISLDAGADHVKQKLRAIFIAYVKERYRDNPDYYYEKKVLEIIQTYELKELETEFLAIYPLGMTIPDITELSEIDQIGEQLIDSLRGLNIFEYQNHIKPMMAAQGEAAFLYFQGIQLILQRYRFATMLHPKARDYLVLVAKKYGAHARNILEELLEKVESIADEQEMIEAYLLDIGPVDIDLYQAYKTARETGDQARVAEMVQTVGELQTKVYEGEMSPADFANPLYPAVVYYTFPPAVGLTQQQYDQLNRSRPDRQDQIPGELDDFQHRRLEVATGRYVLEGDEELNLEVWQEMGKTVRKVNAAFDAGELKDIDAVTVAETLIEMYVQRGSNQPEKRSFLFDTMYRFHLLKDGGKLETGYEISVAGLMKYKEFLGEHVKNDLIRECLLRWKISKPEAFVALQEQVIQQHLDASIGQVLASVRAINKQTNEAKKQTAIAKLNDFLSTYGLQFEDVKDASRSEIVDLLSKALGTVADEELVIRLISAGLMGPINVNMRREIDKFSFESEVGEQETRHLELVISKRREHGVAGYNMGVCVTPDTRLWDDNTFFNVIIFDQETHTAAGGMHVLIREGYVCLPGINPSIQLLSTVDTSQLYDQLITYAKAIASKMGLKGVLIPTYKVIHSNRSQIQSHIQAQKYKIVTLLRTADFSYNPYHYSFKECYQVP